MNSRLAQAVETWSKAQVLYLQPAFGGQPAAAAWIDELASDLATHDGLLGLLDEPSQLVVAYALETLARFDHEILKTLPDPLIDDPRRISIQEGSFRKKTSLGDFARQVQKTARGGPPDAS